MLGDFRYFIQASLKKISIITKIFIKISLHPYKILEVFLVYKTISKVSFFTYRKFQYFHSCLLTLKKKKKKKTYHIHI